MIKKLFLVLTIAIMTLSVGAQEFKVADVKYALLPDGTAEVVDAKKASGNFVLPSTVIDPKTKNEYQVTSIGPQAFKKAKVNSVTISNAVKTIGDEAFNECKQLKSVTIPETVEKIGNNVFAKCDMLTNAPLPKKLGYIPDGTFSKCKSLTTYDLEGIEIIKPGAFMSSGLTAMVIPSSVQKIDDNAFYDCKNLTNIDISESDKPLVFTSGVFYGTPLKNIVVGRPIVYSGDTGSMLINSNRPFSNNPALESAIIVGKGVVGCPDMLEGCSGLKSVDLSRNDVYSDDFLSFFSKLPEKSEVTINGNRLTHTRQSYIDYYRTQGKFKKAWNEFVNTAYNDPGNINSCYRQMEPEQIAANLDVVKKDTYQIIDHYMQKDSLNESEIELMGGLINNILHFIGYDYKKKNMDLEKWASYNILRIDQENDFHKEEYQYLIDVIEFYFQHKDLKEDPYHQAMQLAALCGLGKWAQAAKYYPKVHSNVTERGKYTEPSELEYMRIVINENGQKVAKPVYKKATSSSSSKSDGGSLIEFFTDRAIKGAVNRYERKQEEKRERKRQEEILMKMNNKAAKKR